MKSSEKLRVSDDFREHKSQLICLILKAKFGDIP